MYYFPLVFEQYFLGSVFLVFGTIQKLLLLFAAITLGDVLFFFRALPLCGNMVPFNFLGRCFRSKKILCFFGAMIFKTAFLQA